MFSQLNEAAISTKGVLHQGHLEAALKCLFPDHTVVNPLTGYPFELDIWIPHLSLSFEFQDGYHFTTTWYSHLPLHRVQEKDLIKKDIINQRGDTLVRVPYWWDASVESLLASILFERPDIASHHHSESVPIPLNPLPLSSTENVPDIGELMLASFPLHSDSISDSFSPSNPWWMGEKYDGIRVCWNPWRKSFFTRNGTSMLFPLSFYSSLPDFFLDCEVWHGRGHFAETMKSLVSDNSLCWSDVRIISFDSPDLNMQFLPFEKRYEAVLHAISRTHPFLQYLASVLFDSGEGVVVRKPNSEYVRGRSSLLWKLKAVRADMEALVVSDSAQIPNLPDSSLDTDEPTVLLQLPDGTSFRAPWVAGYVPKKGEVVSFSYDSLSRKSIPVRPKILRARADLVWDDLVQDSLKNNKSQVLNESSAKAAKFTTKPMGYWNSEKNNNLRTLFEKFATSKSLNASDPSTWYFLASDMQKNKQFYSVLAPFKGSVVKALLQVFPNIGLKEAKFPILSNRYWRDVKRRREFFLRFAKTNSIDPKNPHHWYSMSVDALRKTKDSSSVLSFYRGSITRALLHLFPEVNLLSSKLSLVPGIHVNNISAHRKVLENFAQENEFDPLVAVNWFTSEIENKIKSEKGILSILHFYYGNLRKAIGHIFPEIGADKVKHLSPKRKFWDDENNRRQFFVNYAKTKGFDPQDAISWKAVTLSQIREYKSTLAVLEYYNGSLSKALQSLFPQLGLQQIRKKIDKYEDENKRKEFFCIVAREYGLDPLSAEAWYSLPFSTIHKRKGSNSVLKYYNGSIWRALAHLFPEVHLDSSRMRSVRVDEDLKTNTDDQDRKIFMDFAKNKNFDPLVVSNWYALDLRELENSKIVEKYGSYIKALAHLFPEIGIIKSRFHHKLTSKYWTYKNNQKEYFISFAKSKSFDPLIADHWYSVSSDEISASKEGNTVLSFYNNNLALALTSLFPEIHFIMSHFPGKIPSGYWAKVESQRDLFVYFAKMKGFDPLIVSNWYSIMSEDFSRLKGASAVLSYYEDSFVQALIHVFSELKFEKHKFQQIPKNHWVVVANRREFFVQYAFTKKFDPLIPENWYSVTKESFLSTKKSVSLLNFYKNNLSDALIHLFPEIGLDAKQFRQKWR